MLGYVRMMYCFQSLSYFCSQYHTMYINMIVHHHHLKALNRWSHIINSELVWVVARYPNFSLKESITKIFVSQGPHSMDRNMFWDHPEALPFTNLPMGFPSIISRPWLWVTTRNGKVCYPWSFSYRKETSTHWSSIFVFIVFELCLMILGDFCLEIRTQT